MLSFISMSRIWAIIRFELVRLFGSKKGLIVISAFACIWLVIYYYLIGSAADLVSSHSFKDITQQVFGHLNLLALLEWKNPQLSIYWLVAVYLLPIFSLSLSSDQTCSDRERGTLRFILLRTTRTELILGRFIGQTLIMSVLVAITLMVSLLISLANNLVLTLPLLITSLQVFTQLIVILLPFIASMSLINSFVKSAKMSIVVYILLYILGGLIIKLVSHFLFDVSVLFYLYPGEQIDRILGFESSLFDQYFLPLIQTILYLTIANVAMKRASL